MSVAEKQSSAKMASVTKKKSSVHSIHAKKLTAMRGCTLEMVSVLKEPEKAKEKSFPIQIHIESGEIMENINAHTTQREMFVLPSQLNGAEYPSPAYVVSDVMDYTTDNTGGPRGQLSCDLKVAQFICSNASNENQPGINYVEKVVESTQTIKLTNGYLMENPTATKIDCKKFVDQCSHMQILLSRNIAVNGLMPGFPLSRQSARHKGALSTKKRVDLVYASAAPFDSYGNNSSKHWADVCKEVLTQQYYLALAAAVHCINKDKHKSYKIYFMPLGGGVFNNPFKWIYKALDLAVQKARRTFLTNEVACKLSIAILTWKGRPEEFAQFVKLQKK